MSGYDRERVERIVGEFKARNMAEGGAVEGGYDQLNARILKALIKKYGSEAKAREMFRTLDGGELMRILKEAEGYAEGGPVLPADRATGYRAPGQRPDDRLARFGSSFLKSLPGAAQGVATGYVDMLSALNTYLYQLEPAEQIALLKQLPAGLRDMVLSGVESAKQLPAKVAAATPESAGQFGAQLTAEMLLDPTRGVGKTVPTTQVIKPKGGNWPAGAVEKTVGNIKTPKRLPALITPAWLDSARETDPDAYYQWINLALPKPQTPQELVDSYRAQLNKLDLDDPRNNDAAYGLQQEIESETRNAALDTWLDQKLAKYVKSEMASPDDPIRKQIDQFAVKKKQLLEQKDQQINKAMLDLEKARAERGFTPEMLTRSQARLRELRRERDYIARQSGSHINPRELELANRWVPESVPDMRERMGYEVQGIGETPLGKGWENMADMSIRPTRARVLIDPQLYSTKELNAKIEENPWLTKVPPETRVYQVDRGQFDDLGFGHMRDELRNALDPESDLPDALKITPDKLKMLNMAQASKLVDDINAFRATRATEVNAARAGNIATVPVKEYPEQGLKWVELKMPEPEFEPGHGPGPVSGYPSLHGIIDQKTGQSVSAGATPEEARNLYKREERKKALADALKYEGEMLQHCVGGYCEDVVQGRSRIFSLRDYDGRPRVTIEVQPNSNQKMTFEQAKQQIDTDPNTADLDDNAKMEILYKQGFVDEEGNVLPDLPMQIIQVKGANNRKPQPEDIPLVQDFIRSGKYEIAGDERNTGFVKLPKDNMMIAALKRTGNKPPALRSEAGDYFLTEDEHKRLSEWFDKGTAQGFPAPEFAHGGAVKMAAGGKVGYNPAVVDEIVNRVREKLNG